MDAHHLVEVTKNPNIPEFRAGDTVQVNYKVREGERTRTQPFQGVVIRRMGGKSAAACFTVRRVTRGFGVERTFPLYSPHIESVQVQRYGKVRRAKLYYLRQRSGRAARIKEQTNLPAWLKVNPAAVAAAAARDAQGETARGVRRVGRRLDGVGPRRQRRHNLRVGVPADNVVVLVQSRTRGRTPRAQEQEGVHA